MIRIKSKSDSDIIPLFWWSERKFSFKDKENYGDLLSKYIVEKISRKKVKWINPQKQSWYRRDKKQLLAVGSILAHASKYSVVWGSGIIDRGEKIASADFRAVRGPETRALLLNQGYECPEIYGDPALLLPNYYLPEVKRKYKLGIIPHYNDYSEVYETYKENKDILVIDLMCHNIEPVTRQILKCEFTISSSLHGLIVSHAYGIPSVWAEFSKRLFGDGVKFHDYLKSVGLAVYKPLSLESERSFFELQEMKSQFPVLPEIRKVEKLQKGLEESYPFTKKKR